MTRVSRRIALAGGFAGLKDRLWRELATPYRSRPNIGNYAQSDARDCGGIILPLLKGAVLLDLGALNRHLRPVLASAA